jgi:unsaturated rhamnogalacturonyl hydrolase
MKTLIFAILIMASLHTSAQIVLLDSYFNNEQKADSTGKQRSWHYKWGETVLSGFSILGNEFLQNGADTATLYEAPTAANLKKANIYIIVDADNAKENPTPHLIEQAHIAAIYKWVENGGVLVLMGNDSANAELHQFSKLAQKFGITFTDRSRNMVKGKDFPTGAVMIPANHPIFPSIKKAYLKEVSILEVKAPAKASVSTGDDVIMAVSKVGKGTVFAVGDPWLYNEYVDGKRIPADYENPAAVKDLVKWLLQQTKH